MPDDRTGYRRPKRLYFDQVGVNVNSPIDRPSRERRLYKAKNVTIDVDGSLTTRPGFANLYAGLVVGGQTPCHSERRISDDETGQWARIIGTGTHLAVELSSAPGTTSSIDSGYSGNPFTAASWRPTESAKLHLYVADDARMRKVDVTGVDKQIGLPAPFEPPTVELGIPFWKEVSDMQTAAAWAQGGVAGAPALFAGKRVNTTLEASNGVLYDTGAFGWGCFRPVDLTNIGVGSLVHLQSGFESDTSRVSEVHRAGAATTIGSIVYESGSTGLCTIQPTNPVKEFARNAVVKLVNGGTTEYCRVLSTVDGVNGGRCIRLRTTNTWAATHSIQVVNSFRTYTFGAHTSSGVVTQEAIQSTSTGAGTMTLTDTVSVDLTRVSTYSGSGEVPMSDSDYFHLSARADDWSKYTNIRVMFSLDGTFTGNFYYRLIEQSVLVAAAKNTQTAAEVARRARQRAVMNQNKFAFRKQDPNADFTPPEFSPQNRNLPDIPIPPTTDEPKSSGETGTGDNQWSEVAWTRSSCVRVGTNTAVGWKDVVAVRIEATVTGITTLIFNSLNVSGGFEPDVGTLGEPYQYRYRGRDSSTGVVSDYSPECLERVDAFREQIIVTVPVLSASEIDKIDIERFGGSQPQWLLVGTVANGTTTYTDKLSDLAIANNAPYSDYRVLQPWVRYGSKLSGTATIVAGNFLTSSTAISTSIVPGTQITVNGVATAIRRIVNTGATSSRWELTDSIGSATNAAWEIPIPVLAGQPLGAMWRHDTDTYSVMFACDGPYVRWSVGNTPDATRSTYSLEVTQSNDPTVMGFSYNGRCGVFTTSRLIWLTGDPESGFRKDEVPNGHGLFSRWALAVGGRIAWLAKDGIYETGGSEPDADIVDMDLGPLFVNEEGGGAPTTINGIRAPKITSGEAANLRLDYADDNSLMFLYRDQSAVRACLRYVPTRQGWLYYEFGQPLTFVHSEVGKGVRSLVAGDANGKLHLIGGSSNPVLDDGVGIAFELQPFAEDYGDSRPNKRFGDLEVDANPNGQTINVEVGYNNHTTTASLTAITGSSQVQRLYDITSGDGNRARNISIRLHGTTVAGNRPRFLSWEPSVMDYPADTKLRAATWTDCGHPGRKYVRGIVVHADTYGVAKTVRIEKDGGTLIESINVNFTGEGRQTFVFASPTYAHLVRLATADTDDWTLIDWEWIYDKDQSPTAEIWTDGGYDGDKYMQAVVIRADTFNTPKTIRIEKDGGTVIDTITLTHNGDRRETYAFDVTDDNLRIARLLRITTSDPDPWSLIDYQYIYNREPAAAKVWEIQYTGVDARDYFHVFQILLALRSTASTTMQTYADNTLIATDTVSSTSGSLVKTTPIVLPAVKTKLVKWRFESTADLRLYREDCAIWVMPHAGQDYSILKPFGGIHRDRGAEA